MNSRGKSMQNITPCLWFDGNAEEAVNFYTSIFKSSKIGKTSRYTEAGQEIHRRPPGSVMTMDFEINGQKFTALNGGPMFKFTEAISFQVHCDTQEEIDYYWETLSADGDPNAQACGWLKDKFGLSWQIVPSILGKLAQAEPKKSASVMEALLKMKKLDIKTLQQAYDRA
jgi:predicted 3-demethylubiquinone-9 3-methyltransferase (glyoxalase superfamily)